MMRATLTGAVATARVAFAADCTTSTWAVDGVTPVKDAKISIAASGAKWAMKYGDQLFRTEEAAIPLHNEFKVAGVKVFMAGTTPVCAKDTKFATAAKMTTPATALINIKDVVAAGEEATKFVIVGDAASPEVAKKAYLVTADTQAPVAIPSATSATAKKLVSATTIGGSLYAIGEVDADKKRMEKVVTVGGTGDASKFVNVAYTLKRDDTNVADVKSFDIIEANGNGLVLVYTDNAGKSYIAVAADASVAAFVVKAELTGKPTAVMPKGESIYVVIGEKLYEVKGSTVTELVDKVKAAALDGDTLRFGQVTGTGADAKTNLFTAPIAECPKPPAPPVTSTSTAAGTTKATTKSGTTLATVSSAALVAAAAVLII